MATSQPHEDPLTSTPGFQPQVTELELVNISPSFNPVIDGSSESKSSPLTVAVVPASTAAQTETKPNSNSGAGVKVESNAEEIKPLMASTSAHSDSSLLPTSVMPKNRRRPGSSSDGTKVMMTGTVLQGSGGGTPVEVEVELSERELERLTSSKESRSKEKREPCPCGIVRGPHIVALSVLCIPVAFVISMCLSFYNISITWYNLFIYFSEEKSIIHRLTICPLLVLSFPLTVGLSTLLLSIAASFIQVSWSWSRWISEILDGEKGFCGWLCHKMALPDCSPYQLVILDDDGASPF